jgi:hypothetical protein
MTRSSFPGAAPLRKRFEASVITTILESKWWDWFREELEANWRD